MDIGDNYIAYYRVSTTKQGESGAGLEAQRFEIAKFFNGTPPKEEFTDIVSGNRKKLHKRKGIFKAIELAKKTDMPIVVYKLDRLGRDVELLNSILNNNIFFIALDFKQSHGDKASNRMMLTIMMAYAEYESERGSDRTRAGIASKMRAGKKWGNPNYNLKDSAHIGGAVNIMKHWNSEKQRTIDVIETLDSTMADNEIANRNTIVECLKQRGLSKYASKHGIDKIRRQWAVIRGMEFDDIYK